jgi:hypothetical protein
MAAAVVMGSLKIRSHLENLEKTRLLVIMTLRRSYRSESSVNKTSISSRLLHIADVIEDQALETVKPPKFPGEPEIAFRHQQPLDQFTNVGKENRMALSDKLMADRAHQMGFARAGIAENTDVGGA